ncbi:retinal cone rhodopsin-sensitive cGMP 3',5'-cyclic phosphodiesterase subunit gamma-like isoform X2 [Epinephelus moara]|nr:retinal cone rhodopsin-sensitive cGMP 3',5'-cyclic phosphodiesterase subunit gamma-like isoform X2 [Epinephelus moara]
MCLLRSVSAAGTSPKLPVSQSPNACAAPYLPARTTMTLPTEITQQHKSSSNKSVNLDVAKPEAKTGNKAPIRASGPGASAPKFKQRSTRQFKSKPPKRGVIGFGEEIPGMEGLGTDITVICPWEAYSHLELHELAQYGII